ncbi:MAG: hypothetical protein LC115_01380 [Bacteroidia bacterium]|nr:hypothetical protein [Bacteroidia bacterium]
MWYRFLIIGFFVNCFFSLSAQVSIRDSTISLVMVSPVYCGYLPGGDMLNRFGYTSVVGLEAGYKHRSNFYATITAGFLFGETVKERTLFKDLVTSAGLLINQNGNLTSVGVQERGTIIPLRFGKIWPIHLITKNPNSGVYTEVGVQFLEHYIHILTDKNVPMLVGKYLKGYDRLTSGSGVLVSAGYRFFGNRRAINFLVGFDFSYNQTKARRPYDFDLKQYSSQIRKDILYGFRLGWTVPLYKQAPEKQYFF